MKIGELAKRSGASASRIRFYEAQGLLTAVARQANGYREYPAETLMTLEIITSAQQTGFTLEEVRGLLPQDFSNWRHDELLQAMRQKLQDVEAMEIRLAKNKTQLETLIAWIENKPEDISCVTNAQRALAAIRDL